MRYVYNVIVELTILLVVVVVVDSVLDVVAQ